MNRPPHEQTVLVTGGSRGIGAGICRVLLDTGYRVAVGYHREAQCAREIAQEASQAMAVEIDIGCADSVKLAFQQIRSQLDEVDILVNNAAMGDEKPFLELTDADWEAVFSVNLLGTVRCCREALPHMINQQYGRIINISSIAGQWGGLYRVHYAASKAALINLTRSLAKCYAANQITCNAIAPGLVATDLTAAELSSPEGQQKIRQIPLGRLGEPEEVGAAVRYLISAEAGYITGQTLNLNGGMFFST